MPSPQVVSQAVHQSSQTSPASAEDVFAALERLAELHKKGVLTDEEFSAKKAELLARI